MKHDLKVFVEMDERLPEALQETPSGGRLDLSLYFRRKPDGSKWGASSYEARTAGRWPSYRSTVPRG